MLKITAYVEEVPWYWLVFWEKTIATKRCKSEENCCLFQVVRLQLLIITHVLKKEIVSPKTKL